MTMEMSISLEGVSMEMPFSLVGDYQAPDRAQIMMTMDFLGTSTEIEMITIGDTTYSLDPTTGEWSVGEAATSFAPIDPSEVVGAGDFNLEDPVLVGIEDMEGVPVYHLSGSVPASDFEELLGQEISDGLMTIDYWVGVDDYLLRKIAFSLEFTGTMMEGMEGTQEISVTVEMVISDYNAEVSIEAPID
jgi:lipoprotein LprG